MANPTLVASRPVTILSSRVDRRYIPHMAILSNGVYRLNIGIGPDNDFTPGFAYHSYDQGRTWQEAPTPVPRIETCTTLSDGSYYEVDDYFFQDSADPDIYIGNGGFSSDCRTFTKEDIRIHAPSSHFVTLREMRQYGQPQNPWFDLINLANPGRELTQDNIFMGGTYMSSIIELESPAHLLATGYYRSKEDTRKRYVWLYESRDGGRFWEEKTLAMKCQGTPEGATESALLQLDSGDLYVIARTGALMMQTRSSDLGKSWSAPEPIRLVDSGIYLTGVMPVMRKMWNGGLIAVFGRPKSTFTSLEQADNYEYGEEHYGKCGKFVVIDPSGTGREWQTRIDLHENEVACQQYMGVPPEQCIRVQEDTNVRESNSWEYLTVNEVSDDEFLVTYDVQKYLENWNSHPINGVRMVRVRLER